MKKLIFFFFIFIWATISLAQLNCDSLKCPHLADSNSYVILEETVVREATVPQQSIMISCEMLCAIEEARSPIEDIILYWGTVKILVYKREEDQK